MFGSLFKHTGNMFGQNGGHNNPTPQSAGSGSTSSGQHGDPNKKKWGGWPGHGGNGNGGSNNNSQWPSSWPRHGNSQPQQPAPTTPTPTTPTTPPATPAPGYAAGSWQNNWELHQAQQLAGMAEAKRAAEMAKDQRERDWYTQNKTAKWFPHVERYLASRYKHAPKSPNTPGGGGGTPTPTPTPTPTNPNPSQSAAAYTPGTFDRDPRPFT